MTSSTKINRPASFSCHSDSVSSAERKSGRGRTGAALTSLGCSSGRKSGAVWRIPLLNCSCGLRRACMRPSSSGAPATMCSIERTKSPIRFIISTIGSEEGGSGRREISSSTCSSSLSSSPCSSGSLVPKNFNHAKGFDTMQTYRLEIKSDRTWPRRRVSLSVPKRRL
jgi:hypothetical protein